MDYDRITKERVLYLNYSTNVSTPENYKLVYDQAFDSISNWANHGLKSYINERDNKWFLDSLVCFNRNMDKCIMAIAKLNTKYPEIEADGLTYFYGVKIGHKWYFFDGPYIALPRNFYQENTKVPLSSSILKAIAMEEIFKGYLEKNRQTGKWEINRGYFADLTSNAWCMTCNTYKTPAQWDSIYLDISHKNWQDRDTTKNRSIL